MLKKRLIFTLLFQDDSIQLSRNFSLQAVGNLQWFYQHYDFESLSTSIDELVLLNASRSNKSVSTFISNIASICKKCFMPIAAGGGITSIEEAYEVLNAGADKLVVNSALYQNPELVREMAGIFGGQCVVASIDYKYQDHKDQVYMSNGAIATGIDVESAIRKAEQLGVGEIYLTSMDRDGTGQGYDLDMLNRIEDFSTVPIIASGGVGDFEHFVQGMGVKNVTGASTANIFNFVGDGFVEARSHICESGIELAYWDFKALENIEVKESK